MVSIVIESRENGKADGHTKGRDRQEVQCEGHRRQQGGHLGREEERRASPSIRCRFEQAVGQAANDGEVDAGDDHTNEDSKGLVLATEDHRSPDEESAEQVVEALDAGK